MRQREAEMTYSAVPRLEKGLESVAVEGEELMHK